MNRDGYSLAEVMIATAVVAIGMTAGAVLVGAILAQQEVSAASLRAANLQEQAVTLYRLGLEPAAIRSVLPESCAATGNPLPGEFTLIFSDERDGAETVSGGTSGETFEIPMKYTDCTLLYSDPLSAADGIYRSNTVTIIRPVLRD